MTRASGIARPAATLRAALAALCLLLAAGCADLLPKASSETASAWRSFEEARASIDRIVPYRTTAAELKAQGLDPFATPNVQLLTYSDILLRFPIGASFPMDRLDKGLRECLEAGKECVGYSVAVREVRRDRIGNFWLDALNFRRVVDVTGWSFNALVLVVEGRVVYVLHGGQPALREQETSRQPLGPLQGWGEALPGAFR